MAIAEVFLGAFFTLLLEKLASPELLNFARREGIQTQLKKCRRTLEMINAVLSDAEAKQVTDKAVMKWLDDLQDLAYDLDDIVDDLLTEAQRRKIAEESQASSSKVRKIIPTCCTSFTPSAFKFDYSMRSKIDNINSRLESLEKEKNLFNLIVSVEGRPKIIGGRLPTTSLVDEPHIYGRGNDKEAIIEKLLRPEPSDIPVDVIPIVGMGGIGKTTLAQLVYNDDRVKGSFVRRMWVCVSDYFDLVKVTKTILDAITGCNCNLDDLNMLQERIKEKLSNKKFLLVLDDVWTKKYEEWDLLRRPLLAGAPGSKIIVTARNANVAPIKRTTPVHNLKELTDDDCLFVIAQHALGRRNFDEHPDLKVIGEQIVRKCKGLPLAVKSLGGLLSTKETRQEWEDVLHSEIWDLPGETCNIIPALKVSYHYLPGDLKRCFAFCSIFPKDYEFDESELIILWMANDFLKQVEGKKQMEDLGLDYFKELRSRSFFQQSNANRSRFVMHDLMNDLAQFVAGKICSRLDDAFGQIKEQRVSDKAHHIAYSRDKFEAFRRLQVLSEIKRLRTFLPLSVHGDIWNWISRRVLLDLVPNLRCLRVLTLSGYRITEIPDSICKLKHLRCINLDYTLIKELPESLSALCNLQTLSLNNCEHLQTLPSKIGDLINLRHLRNSNTSLKKIPAGIGKLRNLQTLSHFVIGKDRGSTLEELRDLKLLRGTLSVSGLENVMDVRDSKEANLKHKEQLDELMLQWRRDLGSSYQEQDEMDVLEMLEPHHNLKILAIENYGGLKFPSWVGNQIFSEMVDIKLIGCGKCTSLPPVGQLPKLKSLYVEGMNSVQRVSNEFYGVHHSSKFPFPALETLCFNDMPEWEEWCCFAEDDEVIRQFPRLRELTIIGCPKLTGLPKLQLPSLVDLSLIDCDEVVLKSFCELTSLVTMKIDGIRGLAYLPEEFVHFLKALKILKVSNCNELVGLWQNRVAARNLICLRELDISRCQLFSFEEVELELLGNLADLCINQCPSLEMFPASEYSLQKLTFYDCAKLVSLAEMGDLPKLTGLTIWNCNGLEFIPNAMFPLEELQIHNCSSLRSLGNKLPGTLKCFVSDNCRLSESISEMIFEDCINSLENVKISKDTAILKKLLCGPLDNLRELAIRGCEDLESFPDRGLPTPNLTCLSIYDCPNLKGLPNGMDTLISLRSLYIVGCSSLESFPNVDLPPNLKSFWIINCEELKPLSDWGLHKLASLEEFHIGGGFPNLVELCSESTLPPTLACLDVGDLPNLKSLSKGLRRLACLRCLWILRCSKLEYLPDDDHCLSALEHFWVIDCPLLKQKCLKDKGEYWPKIADIPHVDIS